MSLFWGSFQVNRVSQGTIKHSQGQLPFLLFPPLHCFSFYSFFIKQFSFILQRTSFPSHPSSHFLPHYPSTTTSTTPPSPFRKAQASSENQQSLAHQIEAGPVQVLSSCVKVGLGSPAWALGSQKLTQIERTGPDPTARSQMTRQSYTTGTHKQRA